MSSRATWLVWFCKKWGLLLLFLLFLCVFFLLVCVFSVVLTHYLSRMKQIGYPHFCRLKKKSYQLTKICYWALHLSIIKNDKAFLVLYVCLCVDMGLAPKNTSKLTKKIKLMPCCATKHQNITAVKKWNHRKHLFGYLFVTPPKTKSPRTIRHYPP